MVFLVVLAVLLAFPLSTVAGGAASTTGCSNTLNPPTLECGVSSGTASATQTLTVTQTFPIPFTKTPIVYLTPVAAVGIVTSNDIALTLLATDPAITVANVPAADTEIPNHRIQMNAGMVAGQQFSFCFEVTAVGSTALGKIKYSTDSGTTWTDFSAATTVPLWSTTGLQCASEGQTTAIAAVLVAPFTTNGLGPGENVSITGVSMDYIVQAWAWLDITVRAGTVTTSQFQWQARSLARFSQTVTVSWQAVECYTSAHVSIACPVE